MVSGPVGAETVVYAPYGPGAAEVRILDVASGTVAVLATGQTAVAATSGMGADGILYVAGAQACRRTKAWGRSSPCGWTPPRPRPTT